jgi:hypothetical protein
MIARIDYAKKKYPQVEPGYLRVAQAIKKFLG